MILKDKAVLSYRKLHRKSVKEGKADLRVIGNQSEGFRLAAVINDKCIPLWQQRHNKQTECVNFGLRKFGIKARKLVVKIAA